MASAIIQHVIIIVIHNPPNYWLSKRAARRVLTAPDEDFSFVGVHASALMANYIRLILWKQLVINETLDKPH